LCVLAAETCLRRRNGRLPGIICRRLQITAVRRGRLEREGATGVGTDQVVL
jgi:hypothetical protein